MYPYINQRPEALFQTTTLLLCAVNNNSSPLSSTAAQWAYGGRGGGSPYTLIPLDYWHFFHLSSTIYAPLLTLPTGHDILSYPNPMEQTCLN